MLLKEKKIKNFNNFYKKKIKINFKKIKKNFFFLNFLKINKYFSYIDKFSRKVYKKVKSSKIKKKYSYILKKNLFFL